MSVKIKTQVQRPGFFGWKTVKTVERVRHGR